jgi:hypothetical protein
MTSPRKPRKAVTKSLTAAAKRITGRKIKRPTSGLTWDNEAWYHFSVCGELHFVTTTVANALSQIELYPAKRTADGWERIDDDNDPAVIALDALAGDSPTGMTEMLRRFAQNLFVAGDSYLIGHPHDDERDGEIAAPTVQYIDRTTAGVPPEIDLEALCWKVYSAREIMQKDSVLKVAGREFDESQCVIVRVWRPHPADIHLSDSPVRAALPLLRELEALTKLISAQADSTLAGNGVFIVPEGVSVLGGTAPEDSPDVDPFIVDLMDAMMTPISNRDAASSLVPLIVTLPDDIPWQPHHMTFARPLDAAAMDMRTELIRRLALSLDAPPEVMLGNGASNHWAAWQIAEDFVKLHVLPVVGLIRDALVREYLRPVLEANGIANPQDYTIEADASALTLRPNRSTEAMSLFDKGLITDIATREAMGFGEEDAPDVIAVDEAVTRALEMVTQAPSLLQSFTLPDLVAQIREVLGGPKAPEPTPIEDVPADENPPPAVEPGPPSTEQPGEAAA